jgi:hypothetical protein
MTNIIHLVEEMRAKISQITEAEEELVWSLRDTLSRVDEKLLHDVRSIAIEHEARRGRSLHELELLSARIGVFPTGREAMRAVENASPTAMQIVPANVADGFRRGDWRQAASNIEDELEGFFEERVSAQR